MPGERLWCWLLRLTGGYMIILGKLEKVANLRVWLHEAKDFTPWFAEEDNMAILSEAIDIELEVMRWSRL